MLRRSNSHASWLVPRRNKKGFVPHRNEPFLFCLKLIFAVPIKHRRPCRPASFCYRRLIFVVETGIVCAPQSSAQVVPILKSGKESQTVERAAGGLFPRCFGNPTPQAAQRTGRKTRTVSWRTVSQQATIGRCFQTTGGNLAPSRYHFRILSFHLLTYHNGRKGIAK